MSKDVRSPADSLEEEEDSNQSTSEEESEVEALAIGRQRRTTTANRYAALLAKEIDEEDDVLANIFAEDEEGLDEGFASAVEHDSDIDNDDDSDTDDDDQGPTAGQDDLDGERQLEKEQRAAKRIANKRKSTFIGVPVRKKVKIAEPEATPVDGNFQDQLQPTIQKKQRIIPEGSRRASSRAQTVQNKERTLASVKASEIRRKAHTDALRAKKLLEDANKAAPLTQAERLERAAKVERINLRSVTKWEALEIDRKVRQVQKLEALHNRKMEGPVIRWWSRKAEWVDGRLLPKGVQAAVVVAEEAQETTDVGPTISPQPEEPESAASVPETAILQCTSTIPFTPERLHDQPTEPPASASSGSVIVVKTGRLTEPVLEAESHEDLPIHGTARDGFSSLMEEMENVVAEGERTIGPCTPQPQCISTPTTAVLTGVPQSSSAQDVETSAAEVLPQVQQSTPAIPAQPNSPPRPKVIETATRNTVSFLNFSADAIRDPAVQRHVLFGLPLPTALAKISRTSSTKATAAPKAIKRVQPTCVITSLPAKYVDPKTNLPYHGLEAYKAIQKLIHGGCVWSDMLGAWVGASGAEAAGVPAGFRAVVGEAAALVKHESAVNP